MIAPRMRAWAIGYRDAQGRQAASHALRQRLQATHNCAHKDQSKPLLSSPAQSVIAHCPMVSPCGKRHAASRTHTPT
jgi:hypothetical protein